MPSRIVDRCKIDRWWYTFHKDIYLASDHNWPFHIFTVAKQPNYKSFFSTNEKSNMSISFLNNSELYNISFSWILESMQLEKFSFFQV